MARPQIVRGDQTPTRQERRRENTRASLVGAARELFAGKGVEATAIAEITEAGDVGFGSFYNYFDSKEETAEAVLEAAIEEQAGARAATSSRSAVCSIALRQAWIKNGRARLIRSRSSSL